MNLLLDTTVLTDALRGRSSVLKRLDVLVSEGHRLQTTAINIGEVYAGMLPHEAQRTDALLGNLDCIALTRAICARAGRLRNDFARKGQTLSLADMIIASCALEHDLVLVTDNRKNFPVAGLRFQTLDQMPRE